MPRPNFRLNSGVAELLESYLKDEIDQDEFDERMDSLASYTADVCSSVSAYMAGVE